MLLSPEDELLLLAVETVRGSFDRLIGIADLAHLIAAQGCALRWEVLRERAASSHTSRLLALALRSTTLLGVAPPWDAKLGCSIGWLEKIVLRRARSLRPIPLRGEILMALSAPGMARGLRCLVDALLPAPGSHIVRGRRPRPTSAAVSGTWSSTRRGHRSMPSIGPATRSTSSIPTLSHHETRSHSSREPNGVNWRTTQVRTSFPP